MTRWIFLHLGTTMPHKIEPDLTCPELSTMAKLTPLRCGLSQLDTGHGEVIARIWRCERCGMVLIESSWWRWSSHFKPQRVGQYSQSFFQCAAKIKGISLVRSQIECRSVQLAFKFRNLHVLRIILWKENWGI